MSVRDGRLEEKNTTPKKTDTLNERDELLAYLLEREGFERQADYTIPPRDNDDPPPPLSFAQERFWFLDQFEHARPVYNGCKVVRLIGQLRIGVLVECLNLIVRRHEVLRTTYPAPEGRPIARVAPARSVEIPITDLGHISEAEIPDTIERLARQEWIQPINLSVDLPVRARLVRIDHAENLLLVTLHQIACDSQSVAIFFRELWSSYEAKLNGREPELPVLLVQYGDFASWQRGLVTDQTFQSQREYWIRRLSGALPVLNLPTDRPRPPVQGFDGSRLSILLPEPLQVNLKQLSRENGVTLFMTLLTAFKTLLYRYTAQEDLLVGCPVLNRRLPETENLLGSFVNTLVLRTNYGEMPSFREALRRVRETCAGAFTHQDFPFEMLVEELQPQRDLAHNPIFQVMFAFQNESFPSLDLPGLRSKLVETDGGITKFDLTFSLIDKEHGIAGHIEYSTDLFNCDTIERMARNFQTLLDGIVANPDQSIATLPIMTEQERRQILVEWNDTAANYPKGNCIHELFEAQVKRTPDAVAVKNERQQLTYQELNRCSNQLAHYLISLGVGPEKPVGICVERSLEMVIGLLGILKAGGAYVPLEPSYPKERVMFMINEAQPSLVLTEDKLRFELEEYDGEVICLDSDWNEIGKQSVSNPTSMTMPDSLAYVMFTSGSTGHPKGVMITHRGISNRLLWMQDAYQVAESDRVLHKTPISFDVSVWEIFWPLLNGASLVVARPGGHQDGAYLVSLISQQKITVLHFVPSMLRAFLEQSTVDRCEELRLVICSGESLSVDLQQRFFSRFDAELRNLYGPTEASIDVTSWACERRGNRCSVPIGRPIANTQIYILDSYMQPVPIGIPGDLYIGGDGLARGYINQPALTAERFVVNPFSEHRQSRLYRTGDRARHLIDGNIEFLGRIDSQVKIRGCRIELSEIEFALNQHPAVRECVVIARAREPSVEQSLIGYVVPKQQPAPIGAEMRVYLKDRLPDYMIPTLFVMLEALPLTPNGKIDCNALPLPDADRQLDQGFVEPRTEVEELIAQVWREVLKLDMIGIHDNFFNLGGHSLLATRVVARLSTSFKVDITLRKLFESPTVAGLAEHMEYLRHSQFGTSIAPIAPVDRTQPVPLSFSQRRLWYLHKVDANLPAYNIPAAFRIKGRLDTGALERALNEMIARHEVLRSCVKEVDGEPCQEILPSLRLALPVIDLTHLPSENAETETRRIYDADARQLYDLAHAPLMRATLVKLAVDEHVFILNFHHIIADGSSLVIFYKELGVLFDAAQDDGDKAGTLTPLAIQYADFAAWQHEWLKSSSFNTQLEYWKRRLANLPEPCALPTDFDRPMLAPYCGARLTIQLSDERTRLLKKFSRQQSVTMFMTLFATFNVLMSRISGQEDIVMGSTIAGRNHPKTDGLIGFLINALPLRADLSGDPSVASLLQRTRELCLDAFANQDVPFEKVVEEIGPTREPGRNPIFDILFNIADSSDRMLTLSGCEITKLARVDPGAKFDIVLQAPEVNGKIELAAVYNTALFREDRITQLLEQWAALLDQVTSHPELPVSQLSLITDASRSVLPNPKEALDDSWKGTIHELLAGQARHAPESPAVIDENQTWTYEEINQCANRLAHCLIESGLRPKDLVGVYAHRGSSLIVALFGILKAGASFLILDPAYPAARSIDYLRIARPKGWLHLEGSGEVPGELLSCLESLAIRCRMNVPQSKAEILQSLDGCDDDDPATIVTANDAAYVAFTSGSTGEPKAVLGRHGPITHFLPWQKNVFDLREDDRFALISGLAFNHLHRDVFTPLAMGAALYVPLPEIVREPELLCEWLRANSITILHLTPALGQLLLTATRQSLPSVRRIFFGGDVLTRGDVARIRELAPNATIGCFYGATETQRAVGYYEIRQDFAMTDTEANRPIPLGQGIRDVQLLLLNKNGQLSGVGELAELYIRSPHLAECYIDDEGRTKEVFITNPFTDHPNDRLYRTGELGRYLPDGNVEWAGRNDRRVNIRGFRVELEEIETVLKQHPIVRDAAVVLRKLDDGDSDNPKSKIQNQKSDRQLVVYIVSTAEDSQSLSDLLHSYVSARLPDYMVPSHFVILDRLPLSPNGKTDYQALPPVQFSTVMEDSSDVAQSEVEEKLSTIFAQVLSREKVGIKEDFFRLGGHSLLAAQTAARIRETFGVMLDLRAFLESPTVSGLARTVKSLLAAGQSPSPSAKDEREEFEI
jgi:amino acid adenylation domain-containing protein